MSQDYAIEGLNRIGRELDKIIEMMKKDYEEYEEDLEENSK